MTASAPRRSELEHPPPPPTEAAEAAAAPSTASITARAWRWGVWHRDDRAWLAALQERNARLLPLPVAQQRPAAADAPPRVIHQIWLGPRPIPDRCREWAQTWKTLHPEWEYRLWTDSDVEAFGLRNQAGIHSAFDAARNYGEKSDILRYEILERHGGVYADVDVACLQSFEPLLEFSFVAGMANTSCVEISNSVLVAARHHPILLRLIDAIERESKRVRLDSSALALIAQMNGEEPAAFLPLSRKVEDEAMDTIARTGPGLLTKTFLAAVGWTVPATTDGTVEGFLPPGRDRDSVIALPVDYLSPRPNDLRAAAHDVTDVPFPAVSMAVHYWLRTWI